MTLSDSHGLALTGASDVGRTAYEAALAELQCYRADPVATIDRAIAADPGFAMAHAMRAWLHLLGTEPAGFGVAEESHLRAAAAAATDREKGHVAAIGALISGNWHVAGRILEDVTLAHPHDGLALLAGHQIDFFTGNARMLRDRSCAGVARLGCRSPRVPFAARHAGLRLGGDRRLRRRRAGRTPRRRDRAA